MACPLCIASFITANLPVIAATAATVAAGVVAANQAHDHQLDCYVSPLDPVHGSFDDEQVISDHMNVVQSTTTSQPSEQNEKNDTV